MTLDYESAHHLREVVATHQQALSAEQAAHQRTRDLLAAVQNDYDHSTVLHQQAVRDLTLYKERVRAEALRVYGDHSGHIDRKELNYYLSRLDLEPEPIEYEVTLRVTRKVTVTVTVSAMDEDDAREQASTEYENSSRDTFDEDVDDETWDVDEVNEA